MLGPNRLYKSFSYALEGIYLAVKLDQNVRIHLIVSAIVLSLSVFLSVSVGEFLFILLAIFLVLITEMVNTAIEEMTNLIIKEHRMEAKIAKDVAAGAVLLSAVFAAVVASVVLIPRIIELF